MESNYSSCRCRWQGNHVVGRVARHDVNPLYGRLGFMARGYGLWFLVWKGRWVFHRETPYMGAIEMLHRSLNRTRNVENTRAR